MGAEEMQNWIAYCALQRDEYRESIGRSISEENQQKLSDEARADMIRALFSRKQ